MDANQQSKEELRADFRQTLGTMILQVLRLNSDITNVGNAIGLHSGITCSSWQVLGTIRSQPAPLPVAHLARMMGLTRQAVQRTVNELIRDDFVTLEPNQHHRRAPLVVMTPKGQSAYQSASDAHWTWVETWMDEVDVASMHNTVALFARLRDIYERSAPSN